MEFHRDGTLPQNGEIWVFGSNLAGIHGAGAAKVAIDKFGAVWGEGLGLTGKCYAIPTKDANLFTRDLKLIEFDVSVFCSVTKAMPNTKWFVTRVGCGLAGFRDSQIAPMFKDAINCSFAEEWREYLG
jgi:hypothetical protein